MTTIAYRDGLLAADQRVTDDSGIVPGSHCKVFKTKSGWLHGASGNVGDFMRFREWVTKGRRGKPPEGEYQGVLITPKGVIHFVEQGSCWQAPKDTPFAAIGSGSAAALAALHMGASAIRAIEIAILVDQNSGGKVDSVKLKHHRSSPKR